MRPIQLRRLSGERERLVSVAVGVLLAVAVFVVFGRMAGHDFLAIDDNKYITGNRMVQAGLTVEGLRWAFTTTHAEFWHPATWLSYMLDTELFGTGPGGYLFTNLLLHVLNTVLLYTVLGRMTGRLWPSALVAALFGLHPLHVESVAWIAERKDVLSTFFWILTLWGYVFYTERGGWHRYAAVAAMFVLGLMAKPMLVTLPLVLLLLDFWPLRRLRLFEGQVRLPMQIRGVLLEKLPLLAISALFCALAVYARLTQVRGEVTDWVPLGGRVANALISCVRYLGKTVWPQDLVVFYPWPEAWAAWQVAGALAVLLALTGAALGALRRQPYIAVGWFWYLGTLVPVSGLVRVGHFAMADRYTYVPLIGIFIAVAWTVADRLAAHPLRTRMIAGVAGVCVLTILAFLSARQLGYWRNSFTLCEHALEVDERNWFAHFALAHACAEQADYDSARRHLEAAIARNPRQDKLVADWARVLIVLGRYGVAADRLAAAVQRHPASGELRFVMALERLGQGRKADAVQDLALALQLRAQRMPFEPAGETAHAARLLLSEGRQLEDAGRTAAAKECYQKALGIEAELVEARVQLAELLAAEGAWDRALALFDVTAAPRDLAAAAIRGFNRWQPGRHRPSP